jgi:hypothetical protein
MDLHRLCTVNKKITDDDQEMPDPLQLAIIQGIL